VKNIYTHIYPPEVLTANMRRYFSLTIMSGEWDVRYACAFGVATSIALNEENRSLRKAQLMGVEHAIRLSETGWNEAKTKLIRERNAHV
jgi:hypothetical protein